MKHLKNITKSEESDYMRRMKTENIKRALSNPNENQMNQFLDESWSRQVIKGFRIFDFWNHFLGCAIEVDGPEHDRDYDNYRDEYNFRRSGIIVLRVRNNSAEDIKEVLEVLPKLTSLQERKVVIGISGNSKESRRVLSSQPYYKTNLMFVEFLKNLNHKPYWCK